MASRECPSFLQDLFPQQDSTIFFASWFELSKASDTFVFLLLLFPHLPVSCLFCWDANVFESLNSLQLCPSVPSCNNSAVSVPFLVSKITRTFSAPCLMPSLSVYSSDKVMTSKMACSPFFLQRIDINFVASPRILFVFHVSLN